MPWQKLRRGLLGVLGVGFLVAAAVPALAVDGVIEVNQARALKGGVTAGDTPGFPVTIATAGSYRLMSNLTLPDASAGGIDITVDDVEVDLNGFSILGPGTCSATYSNNLLTAVTCTPTGGGGYGLRATNRKQIRVHDGAVRGVGGKGIVIGEGIIHDVQAIQNAGTGVQSSDNSLMRNIRADTNDGPGISMSDGVLESAVVTRSDGSGVHVGGGMVRNVHVQWSRYNGIQAGFGAEIRDCISIQNGWSGITTSGQSLIVGNNIRHNAQWGIVGDNSQTSGYSGNLIWDNDSGTVSGTAMLQIGTNICENNTTCP